ncbi:FAD/NAD(P)-binding protein, partial [Natronobacterium gregoryi]
MYECVIVGGGIHGTYLIQRLLEDADLEREDVTIVDPHDRLLASFRRKAAACEMDELRST